MEGGWHDGMCSSISSLATEVGFFLRSVLEDGCDTGLGRSRWKVSMRESQWVWAARDRTSLMEVAKERVEVRYEMVVVVAESFGMDCPSAGH